MTSEACRSFNWSLFSASHTPTLIPNLCYIYYGSTVSMMQADLGQSSQRSRSKNPFLSLRGVSFTDVGALYPYLKVAEPGPIQVRSLSQTQNEHA